MTKPSEIIDAAMGFIDKPEKWCKGTEIILGSRDSYTQFCARGAVRKALRVNMGRRYADVSGWDRQPYEKVISKHFSEVLGQENIGSISYYNDQRRTTHDDVIAAMTKARNEFQEQGQ